MKRILQLVFLLSILAASTLSAEEKSVYWFNFHPSSDSWTVMLPAPRAKLVYEDTMTAVDIQSIICDGKLIAPEIGSIAPGFPDLVVMDASDGQVVYQATDLLRSWVKLERKKGDVYVMRMFNLPSKIKTLVIDYVIRYPDGSNSTPIRVNFVARDREINILELPNGNARLRESDAAKLRESESSPEPKDSAK